MAYNAKYVHGMGWTLVVMGSLNIILGISADIAFGVRGSYTIFHYISAPIWSGVFVVITGALGISSGRNPTNKCLIVGFMVLGIFTIIFATTCFSLAIMGAIVDGMNCDYDYWNHYSSDCRGAAIALHSVNSILSFAEIVMGFTAAIMSCCGLATTSTNVAPTVVYAQGPNMPPGQGQGAYIIMHTGVPAQGVTYTTVNAPEGIPQQQVFIAPMQGYPAAQVPPPYLPQSNIGTAAANTPAASPVESKTQPPA